MQKSVASPLMELSATLPPAYVMNWNQKSTAWLVFCGRHLFVVESGKISLHIPKSPKSDV